MAAKRVIVNVTIRERPRRVKRREEDGNDSIDKQPGMGEAILNAVRDQSFGQIYAARLLL
jgi:hypothetical protein